MTDVSKHLKYLSDSGWSDLIDSRWKEQVKAELIDKFPDMSERKWGEIERVVFI